MVEHVSCMHAPLSFHVYMYRHGAALRTVGGWSVLVVPRVVSGRLVSTHTSLARRYDAQGRCGIWQAQSATCRASDEDHATKKTGCAGVSLGV